MSSTPPDRISNCTDARPRTPASYAAHTTNPIVNTSSNKPDPNDPRYASPGQKRKHYTYDDEYGDDPWPRKMRKIRRAEYAEHPGFAAISSIELTGTSTETSMCSPVTEQSHLPTPDAPPEPFLPPPQCDHTRHPSYSASQNEPTCPTCSLEHLMADLRCIERMMREQDSLNEKRFYLLGSDARRPKRRIVDEYGNKFCHRNCRLRLSNLHIKLEYLAKKENEWENLFLLNHPDLTNSQAEKLMDRMYGSAYKYSAKYALGYYNSFEASGDFTRSTDIDAARVRLRGRDHEIAVQEEYPEDQDEGAKAHVYNCQTKAQQAYIDKSALALDSQSIILPTLKRPRRNAKAKVAFNSDAQVCIENDVDRLRKQAFNPVCTSAPIGILRTAASTSRTTTNIVSPRDTDPRHQFYIIPTKQTDDGPDKLSFMRRTHNYKPGQWAPSSGSEAVDTSGYRMYKKDPEMWERYREWLQDQAAKWDRSDRMNV